MASLNEQQSPTQDLTAIAKLQSGRPRHRVAALELARALWAGGRIGLTTWTPEGPIGEFFKTLSEFVPAPPEYLVILGQKA